MDKFITVITSGEFVVAMIFAFLISLLFATIVQDVINSCHLDFNTIEYCLSDEELHVGCMACDTSTGISGKYCGLHLGEDENLYGIIVYVEDNVAYYHYLLYQNLVTIKEQE